MQFEERINIKAPAEKIFSIYECVSGWSSWDPGVQSSSINGEFEQGAKGRLKPEKGPEATVEFIEVTKNTSFTTINKLPLCTISFEHELVSSGEVTEAIHRVVFSGWLSPLFGRLIGAGIKKGLPSTMQGLKHACEVKSELAQE